MVQQILDPAMIFFSFVLLVIKYLVAHRVVCASMVESSVNLGSKFLRDKPRAGSRPAEQERSKPDSTSYKLHIK